MDYEKAEKLVGGLASILAGVGAWFKWFLPYWRSTKSQRSIIKGLKTLHAVYSAMERIQAAGATRVVVFGGHNSGGIPRIGSPFYCSAIHWTLSPGHADRIADYTGLSVDAAYIGMLIDLEHHGIYRFDVDGNAGTMLRKYYEAEGITDSVLFYLGCIENTFLYMSACMHSGKFTDLQITQIQLIAQGIAGTLNGKV